MSQASDKVVIGKIGAPYGVKGWVKINSYTEVPEGIFDYSPWLLADGKEYQIDQWRPHGKAIVAKLLDIDSRDDAERIKNLDVSIDAEQLPELGDDGVYWRELNGMQVVTTQGYQLGVVKEVFNTGANDVIRVKAKANDAFGQKERLLPFVFDSVVQTVDKTERVITVEWDPGFQVTAEKWFGIISLFPEMFAPFTQQGVIGRAVKNGTLAVEHFNPRDYTHDRHRTVDDRPYGGGPGMLMMVKPLTDAITAAKQAGGENSKVIYLSPQGKPLTQAGVKSLAANDKLILLCGRYEGVDERVIESHVDEEWSIGDYVLSGGELPAMVMMDAIARLVPGVLGHSDSAVEDSFTHGLLDCPHYTRPEVLDGKAVPAVLRSGDHEKIRQWRLQQSLGRTWLRRPELLNDLALTEEQQRLLEAFQASLQQDDS